MIKGLMHIPEFSIVIKFMLDITLKCIILTV